MSIQNYRPGMNQKDRSIAALQPEYVSVEERSIGDLLKFAREYAKNVRFYNEANRFDGFWTSFLDFTDDEILEIAAFSADPKIFKDDATRLAKYSKPHVALLIAFLKLLAHPNNLFAELTEKNIEFFYRDVLRLEEQAEVPDTAHLVFKLAKDINEHLLKKGVLFSAGKDASGVDVHFELQEDVVLNKAGIAEIKTIHFNKITSDIKYVHVSNDKGDAGFEKILCLALGNVAELPVYKNSFGSEIRVDAPYLRTELYQRIKGKERDELEASDAHYIFDSLSFRYLKDFWYCLDLYYREMNRGYVGVEYPEDLEWEKAYEILEEVHYERVARTRRAELKKVHKDYGFEALMEFAFGEPEPWNMLYKLPESVSEYAALHEIDIYQALDAVNNEAARKYIENKLCMTDDDYKVIIEKKDNSLNSIYGEEVYTLLERAWTKKRNYSYPPIGADMIEGYYADAIYSKEEDEAIERFAPFGKTASADSSESINLGLALSSPLFKLNEGHRTIELVISCTEGSIDHDKIATLLAANSDIFTTSLSVPAGWQQARDARFETGKFIIKPEIRSFPRKDAALMANAIKYSAIDESSVDTYLAFNNSQVYKIVQYNNSTGRVYLRSVFLRFQNDATRLISKLTPRSFVAELPYDQLKIDEYCLTIKSVEEVFSDYFEGKYLVDSDGNIFYIRKFIEADEAEVRYCGTVPGQDPLLINKVWEKIEPEYAVLDSTSDISALQITEVNAACSDFEFTVSDSAVRIRYPEYITVPDPDDPLHSTIQVEPGASHLVAAWREWLDDPANNPGRFEISQTGLGIWGLVPIVVDLPGTGEIIRRYESLDDKGLRVLYQGRPHDNARLVIEKPAVDHENAQFLISGGILTITPGSISQTANQVAVDWQIWVQQTDSEANLVNDPKGFSVASKDSHCWEALEVNQQLMQLMDKEVKICELTDLYGNGIRVLYAGPIADKPRLVLQENSIDMFEFKLGQDNKLLTISYPCLNQTSGNDLLESWLEWQQGGVNDPGAFSIELMGDGSWTVIARTEKELLAAENQVMECTLELVVTIDNDPDPDTYETYYTGVIGLYARSGNYTNAIVEFVEGEANSQFSFTFTDIPDPDHVSCLIKKLTIDYPLLSESASVEDKVRQVQKMLSAWNRLYKKYGFTLIQDIEHPEWSIPDFIDLGIMEEEDKKFSIDFLTSMSYTRTVHPDGFRVKYKPHATFANGSVVIQENTTEQFDFVYDDAANENMIILFILYPIDKQKRTVDELLAAWQANIDPRKAYFSIVKSGTGKWQITGITDKELLADVSLEDWISNPVKYTFYEYKTPDVNGFTVTYTAFSSISPKLNMVEHETDDFAISVTSTDGPSDDVPLEHILTIRYPRRKDKRSIVALLKAWHEWLWVNEPSENLALGFGITDTSPLVASRCEAPLLVTGDSVKEYAAGGDNGLRVTYTGFRDDVTFEIEKILDFTDADLGQKLLWDNGLIYTIKERLDKHTVVIEPAGDIDCLDEIKLYQYDAFALNALRFVIKLDQNFPAIVPLQDDSYANWPVVKLMLDNSGSVVNSAAETVLYDYFKTICIERVDINVAVQGIQDIKMRGDLAMINPENPFAPFGITPAEGARFYFANSEICEKKLDSLQINLNWTAHELVNDSGLPDLERHYYAYSHCGFNAVGTINNRDFETRLSFLNDRSWIELDEQPRQLFAKSLAYANLSRQTYRGEIFDYTEDISKDPLDWPRYYKLDLCNQGFLLAMYDDVLTEMARASNNMSQAAGLYASIKREIETRAATIMAAKKAEAEARAKGDPYTPPIINAARELPGLPENDRDISSMQLYFPYTPEIISMRIDYTASAKCILNEEQADKEATIPVELIRFHPFGYVTLGMENDEDDYMVPQYSSQGYLFIGLENLQPLQNISLLMQMVSGSGDASLDTPKISWSYMAANKWIAFEEAEIIKDMTYGLQDTGITRFAIPEQATTDNTMFPAGRCWLRAEALNNITAVPDILDIQAQSIEVSYVNHGNDPNRLAEPLAAESIKDLVSRDSAILEVQQPYSSFDGKKQEENRDFFVRVSERLKHKSRALAMQDYEKMILAEFQDIYKVKCVPQEELELLDGAVKGEVTIIAILKNANAKPFFPLKPKTPANILAEIKRYIKQYMPSQVTVNVRNPRFEEIRYRLAVKFKPGCDQGFYISKLNGDIMEFLSPWAYQQDAEISFGSSVFSSSVINYIENKDYVDYVANFMLLQQIIKHDNYTEVLPLFLTEDNVATVKYPDSILVSAENHIIDVIRTDFYDAGAFQGIGYMQIGTDFYISRPGPVFTVGIGQMELEGWAVMRYAFAGIMSTMEATGSINGETQLKTFSARNLSRKDSQKIWDRLVAAQYLDNKGNVITAYNLFQQDFPFMLTETESFADFIAANQAEFDFNLKLEDFDQLPEPLDGEVFSFVINAINSADITNQALNILKNGLGFAGQSQYPFLVY